MSAKSFLPFLLMSAFLLALSAARAEENLIEVISAGSAEVTVNDSGPEYSKSEMKNHEGHRWMTRTLSLNTGKAEYEIKYEGCVDEIHESGFDSATNGIGMSKPSFANWYGGTFFSLVINHENIIAFNPADVKVVEQGKRGIIDFNYTKPYRIKLRFMALPDDDKLYFKIDFNPEEEITSIAMTLTAYPVTFTTAYKIPGERWIKTPRLDGKQGQTYELTPDEDWWVVYYDKLLDPAAGGKNAGPGCALLLLPEEINSGQVKVGDYGAETALDLCPVNSSIRLMLWDFAYKKDMPNAEAIADMVRNGHKYRTELEDADF